jgi:hypothetical protein
MMKPDVGKLQLKIVYVNFEVYSNKTGRKCPPLN